MGTPAQNLRLLQELQDAINALPSLTVPVVIEDDWGQRYELLHAFVARAGDPALVLTVRMHAQHPDQDRGVIR